LDFLLTPALWLTIGTCVLLMTTAHAATFSVTTTNDTGAGSLRAAISNANVTAGSDTINFSIAGAGVHTIKPASALPDITDPVVIDGYTQPGTSMNTLTNGENAVLLIVLNGSVAGAGVNGLAIDAGNSTVRGLVINGFSSDGIALFTAGGNLIEGNFIGTDATGKLAVTNSGDGVGITVPNNLIGGDTPASRNLISGNAQRGVDLANANVTATLVKGNFIGTDATGTNALPNGFEGVAIFDGTGNIIGTPAPYVSNLISGNGGGGVGINGSNCTGNLVMNNLIGTDVTGTNYLPNLAYGVSLVDGYSNFVGNASTPFARNIVSGNRFSGVSIGGAHATGNFVQGNFIGTDVTGMRVISNTFEGVTITDAGGNLIGGTNVAARNVISGNGLRGVFIGGATTATNNLVQGNFIGTDLTGSNSLPNADGVQIFNGSGNLIGGTNAAARNVLSGNTIRGVVMGSSSVTATGNFLQGNFIGTDPTGTKAVPNLVHGVQTASPGNTIGGTAPGAGNLISGNSLRGISLAVGGSNSIVQGNLIGTDITGTSALPNMNHGIVVFGSGNLVGGTITAARNLISGNSQNGVVLSNTTSTANLVEGNFIGTDLTGLSALGNGSNGVLFMVSPSMNVIGGTNAGAGNVIAFNGLAGVAVASGTNNAIRANSIFSNSALGIDLLTNGVTADDACDLDSGPNNLQNFPVLTAVTNRVGSTTISGTLNSASNSTFALDFYASLACDPSGFGQGKTFLGSTNVTTDASCNASFTATLATPLLTNQFLTATATDTNSNTSEFSQCLAVTFDPDSNGDGLPDLWQVQYFGSFTSPNAAPTADPDGDGQNNLAEFLSGTDPTNSASAFRIIAIARETNNVRVTWMTGSSKTNALERTAGDASGNYTNNFVPIFTVTNTVGTTTNYLDIGAAINVPAFYYRVRLVQ
jgi:titin